MNFKTFPVASTTIFPIANSTAGGQLVTEWNLRCRDMVSTDPNITYDCGHSYVHSLDDFEVRVQQDDSGTILSNSTLEVLPGRAILNGHYVKEEAHMYVDLLEANSQLKLMGKPPLTGKLAIGIRVYYSTESTMVGSMEPEDDEDFYVGVQLIVLPESDLKTPSDTPGNINNVTCHLKLAKFTFLDNEIRGVINSTDKTKYIDANRITNIEELLDQNYLSRNGINPKKLYVFAGKQINKITNDTWCDATDSLFVWDENPVRVKDKPAYKSARFLTNTDGEVELFLPHKGVDGMKVTLDKNSPDYGKDEYYKDVRLELPKADFSTNTSGTVDSSYTKRIKDISRKMDEYFHLVKGNQVAYIETLGSTSELPPINDNWEPGDYTLVNVDNYALAAEGNTEYNRPPSTFYALLPGPVTGIKFAKTGAVNSDKVPEGITGVQIGTTVEKNEKPITSKTTQDLALSNIAGSLNQVNIVPQTVKYTTPEGIIFTDKSGNGYLEYSDENTSDEGGSPSVLEADVSDFEDKDNQKYTIKRETVDGVAGYSIVCNGLYLTVSTKKPYKLYFNNELTIYGLFLFLESDNRSQTTGIDITNIKTEESPRTIRPVEIICKSLVMLDSFNNSKIMTGVDELISSINTLLDKDSGKGIPAIRTSIDAVIKALEMEDSESATKAAANLKDIVDKVFSEDSPASYKTARTEVDQAKKAVETAASADKTSVSERVNAINKAYDALDALMKTIKSEQDILESHVENLKKQKAVFDGEKLDYNQYARISAYVQNKTEDTGSGDAITSTLAYVYAQENQDSQKQLWQMLEQGGKITLFNSYYGKALTEQDAEKLKQTKYIIDYNTGSIKGIPSIGSASFTYYSSNILQDILNYFSVSSETHGVKDKDYFVYRYREGDNFTDYYYVVSEEGKRYWSDPVWLTGVISLATTTQVGGFLNVPDTALDGGYVYLNDEGYLQLLDYNLLRSGAAAYQLGENVTVSSGISTSEIQEYLDNYVNQRVAFPSSKQIQDTKDNIEKNKVTGVWADPNVIHITMNISAEDKESELNITGIDSRFGSSVYVHITGTANSKNTIVFSDIEKLRIDNAMEYNQSDPPKIEVYRCGIYYDASVMNMIIHSHRDEENNTGMHGIHFWYQRYESTDPDIVVNDMTVSEINAPKITDVIDFWNATSPNDNHFHVALHSVSFAHDGTITGCGLLIANDTTSNIEEGHHISAGKFTLPQGTGLEYPEKCMTHQLKVTGTFESGYRSNDGYYVMQDTMFSALTQSYSIYDNATKSSGSILFHTDVNLINVDFGGISTEAWEPDTFHVFYGASLA